MTERHHYKYVVLDSSKENDNAVQAKFIDVWIRRVQ